MAARGVVDERHGVIVVDTVPSGCSVTCRREIANVENTLANEESSCRFHRYWPPKASEGAGTSADSGLIAGSVNDECPSGRNFPARFWCNLALAADRHRG